MMSDFFVLDGLFRSILGIFLFWRIGFRLLMIWFSWLLWLMIWFLLMIVLDWMRFLFVKMFLDDLVCNWFWIEMFLLLLLVVCWDELIGFELFLKVVCDVLGEFLFLFVDLGVLGLIEEDLWFFLFFGWFDFVLCFFCFIMNFFEFWI